MMLMNSTIFGGHEDELVAASAPGVQDMSRSRGMALRSEKGSMNKLHGAKDLTDRSV